MVCWYFVTPPQYNNPCLMIEEPKHKHLRIRSSEEINIPKYYKVTGVGKILPYQLVITAMKLCKIHDPLFGGIKTHMT